MTTIALVRHGQTNLNLQRRWQGSTDEPLNNTGMRQIAESAPILATAAGWEAIICSPLLRAQQTATIISVTLGLPAPVLDDRLVEQHGGEAETMLEDEVRARWPREEDIPDSETRADVQARGATALCEIADAYRGRSIVVVTHGTFIRLSLERLTRANTLPLLPNGGFAFATVDTQTGTWTVETSKPLRP